MGQADRDPNLGSIFPQSGVKLTMPSSVKRCASEGKEAMLGPANRAQRLSGEFLLQVVRQEPRNPRRERECSLGQHIVVRTGGQGFRA